MKKKQLGIILIIAIIIFGIILFALYSDKVTLSKSNLLDPKNSSFNIGGFSIALKDGYSEVEIDSVSKLIVKTKYVGKESFGDLDNDGRSDVSFILSQDDGASGVFYYVTSILNKKDKQIIVTPMFIGTNISPINTYTGSGVVKATFTLKIDNGATSTSEIINRTSEYKLNQNNELIEVTPVQTDDSASNIKLESRKWSWVKTVYNNDKIINPIQEDKFTITFDGKSNFSATTDCNGIGGEYVVNRGDISLDKMMSTEMYCEGSQEQAFQKMLKEVSGYLFTSQGELVLMLKMDTGSIIFK